MPQHNLPSFFLIRVGNLTQLNNFISVIIADNFANSHIPAFHTFMNNRFLPIFYLQSDRNHQTPARLRPIPGKDINMFATQTLRTMICIPTTNNFIPAIFTNKGLNIFYELSRHVFQLLQKYNTIIYIKF